jgi:1,4-dihydroxy-2-naphthoyl-CoA synthase
MTGIIARLHHRSQDMNRQSPLLPVFPRNPLRQLDELAAGLRHGQVARQLAEKAPLALRMAKESVLKAFDSPLIEGLVAERKSFYFLFSTDDQKEGMRAFLEKRKAVFKGR